MKFFLSKYSALEVATLPPTAGGNFKADTFQERAQMDVGGLFDFEPIGNHPAAHAALHQMRLDLATRFDYTSDGMAAWLKQFQKDYGTWSLFAHSMAYATLDPEHQRMVLFTSGTLQIWRVQMGETPKPIQTNGEIVFESTQIGDIWLITTESKKDDPTPKIFKDFVYDYAVRLNLNRANKKDFYILSIENQIDTNREDSIPNKDERIPKGVLAIVNQRIKAGQPFIIFENLLKSLSTHAFVGKEATALLERYAPVVDVKPPVVKPEPPVVNVKPPVVKPEPPVVEPPETEPSRSKFHAYIIGVAIVLGVLSAFKVHDILKQPSSVPPKMEIPKHKPTIPALEPSPEQTPATIPPTTTPTQPTPKPPVNPSPTLPPVPSVSLTNVNDLMKRAENNIEQSPKWIQDALTALDAAKKTGLDKTAYDAKVAEIGKLKQKVVGKLKTEAEALSNTAENTGKEGKAPKAVRELQAAKAKLELEKQLDDSKKVQERLQKVNERILYWESVY